MPALTPETDHASADAVCRTTDGLRENPEHTPCTDTPSNVRRCGRWR
ncbi:hypothetical protein [Streptomyces sp. NPDC047042]